MSKQFNKRQTDPLKMTPGEVQNEIARLNSAIQLSQHERAEWEARGDPAKYAARRKEQYNAVEAAQAKLREIDAQFEVASTKIEELDRQLRSYRKNLTVLKNVKQIVKLRGMAQELEETMRKDADEKES